MRNQPLSGRRAAKEKREEGERAAAYVWPSNRAVCPPCPPLHSSQKDKALRAGGRARQADPQPERSKQATKQPSSRQGAQEPKSPRAREPESEMKDHQIAARPVALIGTETPKVMDGSLLAIHYEELKALKKLEDAHKLFANPRGRLGDVAFVRLCDLYMRMCEGGIGAREAFGYVLSAAHSMGWSVPPLLARIRAFCEGQRVSASEIIHSDALRVLVTAYKHCIRNFGMCAPYPDDPDFGLSAETDVESYDYTCKVIPALVTMDLIDFYENFDGLEAVPTFPSSDLIPNAYKVVQRFREGVLGRLSAPDMVGPCSRLHQLVIQHQLVIHGAKTVDQKAAAQKTVGQKTVGPKCSKTKTETETETKAGETETDATAVEKMARRAAIEKMEKELGELEKMHMQERHLEWMQNQMGAPQADAAAGGSAAAAAAVVVYDENQQDVALEKMWKRLDALRAQGMTAPEAMRKICDEDAGPAREPKRPALIDSDHESESESDDEDEQLPVDAASMALTRTTARKRKHDHDEPQTGSRPAKRPAKRSVPAPTFFPSSDSSDSGAISSESSVHDDWLAPEGKPERYTDTLDKCEKRLKRKMKRIREHRKKDEERRVRQRFAKEIEKEVRKRVRVQVREILDKRGLDYDSEGEEFSSVASSPKRRRRLVRGSDLE